MKLIKVHTSIPSSRGAYTSHSENDQVSVLVKSWYEKPVFWISAVTAVTSVLSLVQQYHPTIAWVGLAGGIINIVASLLESVVVPQSVVPDTFS